MEKFQVEGNINEIILEQALEIMKIILKKDNISFDTNDFDISFCRGLGLEDGAATLTPFLQNKYLRKLNVLKEHKNEKIKIIICGGGRKNLNLVKQIKLNSKKIFIFNSEDFNLNGDFIESQAFAYLAIRSILSLPISFPSTTGCSAPCTGGEKLLIFILKQFFLLYIFLSQTLKSFSLSLKK